MSASEEMKLGVTLYSFNQDFYTYQASFEECLARVGSLGPGQGVEVVAPQMMRGYPSIAEESQQIFLRAADRYGMVPTCLAGYSDPTIITGRDMNDEEQFEYLAVQVQAAKRMGFAVLRIGACETVFTRLVSYAERMGVKLGIEIHSPRTIELIGDIVERVEQVDSEYLGFVPDWGCFCHSVADVFVNRQLRLGVPRPIADRIVELWDERVAQPEMEAEVEAMGGDEIAQNMVMESQVYFAHGEPAELRRIMPRIVHTHGKFFHADEGGTQAIRLGEVVAELRDGGYSGWISCEYEGHRWVEPDKLDALGQIKAIQNLIRRELAAPQAVAAG